MSNFFDKVLTDLDGLEQDLLGPDYSYHDQIKSPSEIGMSGAGSIPQLGKNIMGLVAYTELLVSGGGEASKVNGPLGDQFFLKTGAKCKDTATGQQVTRSLYINNIPEGDIPFISSGLGMNFTIFEGVVPGTLSNLSRINPLAIFQSFLGGSNPDCMAVTLQTVNANNEVGKDTGYLTTSEVENMDPCVFPNFKNPITGDTKVVCNSQRKPSGNFNCVLNSKYKAAQFKPANATWAQGCNKSSINEKDCKANKFCQWNSGEGFENLTKIPSDNLPDILYNLYIIMAIIFVCYMVSNLHKSRK